MTDGAGAFQSNHGSEAGFTVLELLVALALFSLLSLTLFESVKFGMHAWMRGTEHVEQTDQSLHVQNLLRHLIEDAYPLFLSEDPTRGHVDFDGTSSTLVFLASAPIALGAGGRSRLNLSVEHSGNHADLVLTSKRELAWPEDRAQPIMRALLGGTESIEFAYFGTTSADRPAEWHDAWRGQPVLPQLLRVQVRFAAGDLRTWPDLLIAPRIAADVACLYDALTNRCRGR
jgi:general secretion pathway protein J